MKTVNTVILFPFELLIFLWLLQGRWRVCHKICENYLTYFISMMQYFKILIVLNQFLSTDFLFPIALNKYLFIIHSQNADPKFYLNTITMKDYLEIISFSSLETAWIGTICKSYPETLSQSIFYIPTTWLWYSFSTLAQAMHI